MACLISGINRRTTSKSGAVVCGGKAGRCDMLGSTVLGTWCLGISQWKRCEFLDRWIALFLLRLTLNRTMFKAWLDKKELV
jgi:hypothetical protein